MIGRFFVAAFVFVIAILHDFFHGILTKEEFKKGWPMYVSYVKTGNWKPEPSPKEEANG